ncbi:MAG: hypothetical protein L0211_09185 [Planctomycetaceae bacterium]|nr:hypothetical protein [Planctomycetaceae bacterium]
MSLTSDIASDWQFIEGVETVRVRPQDPEQAEVTNVKGLRKAMGGNPLVNATLGIDPNDVVWHVWQATLEGVELKNGDLIFDSQQAEWTVLSVGQSVRSGRFICICRQRE